MAEASRRACEVLVEAVSYTAWMFDQPRAATWMASGSGAPENALDHHVSQGVHAA